MAISEAEAVHLRSWVTKKIEHISEADKNVLAEYVVALLQADSDPSTLRQSTRENLEDFLRENTDPFVEDLMTALRNKSFIPKSAQQMSPKANKANSPQSSRSKAQGQANGSPPKPNLQKMFSQDRKRSLNEAESSRNAKLAKTSSANQAMQMPNNALPMNMGFDFPLPPFPPFPGDPMSTMMALSAMSAGMPMGPLPPITPVTPTNVLPALETNLNDKPKSGGKRNIQSTIKCKDFYHKGECSRGLNCNYAHGDDEYIGTEEHPGARGKKFATLCKNFEKRGYCFMGEDCKFAHGEGELAPYSPSDEVPGKKVRCWNWSKKGSCPMGDRCQFLHGDDDSIAPPPKAESASKKSNKAKCWHWERDRTCPVGDNCNYLHEGKAGDKSDILCWNWEKRGTCPMGDRCKFKHGAAGKSKHDTRRSPTRERRDSRRSVSRDRYERRRSLSPDRHGRRSPRGDQWVPSRGDSRGPSDKRKDRRSSPMRDEKDSAPKRDLSKLDRPPKVLCIHWERRGHCSHGNSCTFAHGEAELNWKASDANKASSEASKQDHSKSDRKEPQTPQKSITGKNNTAVVVEKIPTEYFNDRCVREFFDEFGTITELVLEEKRGLALVRYDNHDSAEAAFSSPKVIFNNRFVRVYWWNPNQQIGSGKGAATADIKPTIDPEKAKRDADAEKARKDEEAARKRYEVQIAQKNALIAKIAEMERQKNEIIVKQDLDKKRLQLLMSKLDPQPPPNPTEATQPAQPSPPTAAAPVKPAAAASIEPAKPAAASPVPGLTQPAQPNRDEGVALPVQSDPPRPSSVPAAAATVTITTTTNAASTATGTGASGTAAPPKPPLSRTEALRAQLKALEAEARSLGLDPSKSAGAKAAAASAAAKPPALQRHYSAGAADQGLSTAHKLDNRPRTVKVDGVLLAETGDALKAYLNNIGATDFVNVIAVTGAEKPAVTVSFQTRVMAEKLYYGSKDIPGVGQVDFSWVLPPTINTSPTATRPPAAANSPNSAPALGRTSARIASVQNGADQNLNYD